MDFNNLDRAELARHGLVFATGAEAEAFGRLIRETLEIRVGEAIREEVGDLAAEEYDECPPADEEAWLETNCPNFRDLARAVMEALERELMEYRDRIPGVIAAE